MMMYELQPVMRGSPTNARLRSLCGRGYMILTSKSVWFSCRSVAARQPLHSHLLTSRTKGRNSPMKEAPSWLVKACKSWFSLLDMKMHILLLWILYRYETHLGLDTNKTAWEQLLLHIIRMPGCSLTLERSRCSHQKEKRQEQSPWTQPHRRS